VIAEDKFVDNLEHEIEQDCLKILLMEHPVASDFRDVSAALKMITDLERIADQAADISEIALQFGDEKFIKEPEHIELMAKYAIEMVKDGVQSYVNRDLTLARSLEKHLQQFIEHQIQFRFVFVSYTHNYILLYAFCQAANVVSRTGGIRRHGKNLFHAFR